MGISRAPAPAPTGAVLERVRTLPDRFRAEAADGFSANFALRVDEHGFEISVGSGRCLVGGAEPMFPTARVATDTDTWLALDDGVLTSIAAFLDGRVAVRGNVEHAVRLQSLFHPSGRERSITDLEHVTIRAGGETLSAYTLGDGPPLVLLHGLGASKVSWLPLLDILAERYRVVVPDLPGHGESTKPRTDYSPRFYASVVRDLLDAIGVDRAVLVGNSMGGRVALEVAGRSPERVGALALLDPALPDLPVPYYARFARILPTEIAALPLRLRRRVVETYIRQLFADPDRLPRGAYLAGADEFMRIYRSGRARVALLSSLRGLIRDPGRPFWARARRIEAPTMIVWGAQDRLVPVRFGRRLAAVMPSSELRVFDGVGHVPQFEAPARTIETLLPFLEAYAPPRASSTRKQAPRGSLSS